jgi:hypothetical protein
MRKEIVASIVTSMLYLYTMNPEEYGFAFDFVKEHIGEKAAIEHSNEIIAFSNELSMAEFSFLVLTVMKPIMPLLTYLTIDNFAFLSPAAKTFSQELNEPSL